MLRNLPPLIQLRDFETAARHFSFKLAAHGIHVSPSAISHQVKNARGNSNSQVDKKLDVCINSEKIIKIKKQGTRLAYFVKLHSPSQVDVPHWLSNRFDGQNFPIPDMPVNLPVPVSLTNSQVPSVKPLCQFRWKTSPSMSV